MRVLSFVFTMIFSVTVFAADPDVAFGRTGSTAAPAPVPPATFFQRISELNGSINTQRLSITALEGEATGIQQRLGPTGCRYVARQVEGCKADANITPAEVSSMTLRSTDIHRALTSARKDLDALEGNLAATKAEEAQTEASRDLQFKYLREYAKVSDDLNSTAYKWLTVEDKLDAIEQSFDSMALGAYFQDKIGALLNSRVFCDAVNKKCESPNTHTIQAEDLKEIFGNTSMPTRSGADQRKRTWDAENARRKAKGSQ